MATITLHSTENFQQIITASVIVEQQFAGQKDDILTQVRAAINRYINGLGINGDVILTELIFQVQGVTGVVDVIFASPTTNVIIGAGELARVIDANIDLT